MRTAHLIVSATAFAAWSASAAVYFVLCDNAMTDGWYLYGPAAVLPSFWCLYAWIVSRRAEPYTQLWLLILAVPVLMCGLGMALAVAGDVSGRPPEGLKYHIGMGAGMVGGCCWFPVVPCGLISFIWAVGRHIKSLRQSDEES